MEEENIMEENIAMRVSLKSVGEAIRMKGHDLATGRATHVQ